MGWFGEDTPLEIYEKNLLSAVKNGHVEQIKALMTTQLDVPAAVFNKALNKAVKDDKTKTVEALLSNRTTQWSIDTQSLRDIVENGNGTMFRILHKSGWTFEGIQYTGENAYHYNKRCSCKWHFEKRDRL
jgi:hypothetical protein